MAKTPIYAAATLGLAGLIYGLSAHAADGAALFKERLCATCHGAAGLAPIQSNYPKLGGQQKPYLITQFQDIKSGARSNALSAIMRGIVQGVADEEIVAIAEYLSTVKRP